VRVGDALGAIDESAEMSTSAGEHKVQSEPPRENEEKPAEPRPAPEIRSTPVAKNVARNENIDLSTVEPVGQSGRITKADVEKAAAHRAEQAAPAEKPYEQADIFPSPSALNRREERGKMTPRRK